MKAGLFAALACAGCAPVTEPYPVAAAAELMPLAADITGPIEILGDNSAAPAPRRSNQHTPHNAPREAHKMQPMTTRSRNILHLA